MTSPPCSTNKPLPYALTSERTLDRILISKTETQIILIVIISILISLIIIEIIIIIILIQISLIIIEIKGNPSSYGLRSRTQLPLRVHVLDIQTQITLMSNACLKILTYVQTETNLNSKILISKVMETNFPTLRLFLQRFQIPYS